MKKKKNEIKLFCEFVIPPMLIWASIVVIPLIYGIYLTFTNWNGLSPNYDLVVFPTTPQSLQIKPSCLLCGRPLCMYFCCCVQ